MKQRTYTIRRAVLDDCELLYGLIQRSARSLGVCAYTARQIEGALLGAFGVDTQLIRDGTYFVVEDQYGSIVACGGWSRRRTLFGSDQRADRQAGALNPAADAAKIRAFFVDPGHVRKGIARAVLERCEGEALAAGFSRAELMATLTGVPFYEAHGYVADKSVSYEMEPDLSIEFVAMSKAALRI
jgi:GNAT superfamily N-acetyltransferase